MLLIAPYIHDFAAYDLWMKPLGLLYVAAAAEAAGYTVRVVNCLDRLHPAAINLGRLDRSRSTANGKGKFSSEEIPKPAPVHSVPLKYKRYGIPLEAFRKELRDGPSPDVIGVGSMMTYWYPGVAETIELAREEFPGVPIVLGGVYATLCPSHARRHTGADYVVEGAGEQQFLDLLREVIGPGRATAHPTRLRPAYHLLPRLDSVSMLTSRGCPFSCAYCASRLLSSGFVQRPVEEVVEEIGYYAEERQVRNVAFYDDALLVRGEEHIKPVLREVLKRRLHVRLHTPNGIHPNLIDQELAELMRQSGFYTLRLSVESIAPDRIEDSCGKISVEGFRQGARLLFSAGYVPGSLEAYVLMGVPGQPPEEVEETMQFVHEQGGTIRLADFSPIPGTRYFHKSRVAFGLNLDEPLLQNSSVLPYMVPGQLESYRRLKSHARSLNERLRPRTIQGQASA